MRSSQIHHRRPRGMGGSKRESTSATANGLVLCGSGTQGCHGWVESNRKVAIEQGFIVPQHRDPSEVPVLIKAQWRLYDNRGGWRPLPA